MSLTLITAPAIEPLTLADAKAHARVSVTDDDALITAFIQAARERCENMLGRALITQTWEKVLDQFPTAIQLSWPPIQSIVSVKYIDANGAQQTLAPANYVLDNAAEPGWLVLTLLVLAPSLRAQKILPARFGSWSAVSARHCEAVCGST